MQGLRVRFAPSPTGRLHVGGARTALFNWLFARHNNGTIVLRIDDTDLFRSTPESLAEIISALRWLDLDWDEGPEMGGDYGPYIQSQRSDIYRQAADHLLEKGAAYYCFCTPDEVAADRIRAQAAGLSARYSGRCYSMSIEERDRLLQTGRPAVIRLKVPEVGQTVLHDLVRGEVSFDNSIFDDLIIIKSNGIPTYNFACAVDDHFMAISHVLRAEEHLSNTPKQIIIYQALGYELPVFAHLPMILAPDRSKLSKRHGATSVEEFREQGILPESLVNYLALLGWSPSGDQEFFTRDELISLYNLERVSKNPSIYDIKKLAWMNGYYLLQANLDRLAELALPFLQQRGILHGEAEIIAAQSYLQQAVALIRGRVKTLDELAEASTYFFSDDFAYEKEGVDKYFRAENAKELLHQAAAVLEGLPLFSTDMVEGACRNLAESLGIKAGTIIHVTRLAVTGRTVGPGLFEILEVLGPERSVNRMRRAAEYISANISKENGGG